MHASVWCAFLRAEKNGTVASLAALADELCSMYSTVPISEGGQWFSNNCYHGIGHGLFLSVASLNPTECNMVPVLGPETAVPFSHLRFAEWVCSAVLLPEARFLCVSGLYHSAFLSQIGSDTLCEDSMFPLPCYAMAVNHLPAALMPMSCSSRHDACHLAAVAFNQAAHCSGPVPSDVCVQARLFLAFLREKVFFSPDVASGLTKATCSEVLQASHPDLSAVVADFCDDPSLSWFAGFDSPAAIAGRPPTTHLVHTIPPDERACPVAAVLLTVILLSAAVVLLLCLYQMRLPIVARCRRREPIPLQ